MANRLLDALGPADRNLLAPYLQDQELERGRILYAAGAPVTHVYFLQAGIISLEVASSEGRLVESATVGNEGAVGLGGVLGGAVSFTRQKVELPGRASMIERRRMREAVEARALELLRQLCFPHPSDCGLQCLARCGGATGQRPVAPCRPLARAGAAHHPRGLERHAWSPALDRYVGGTPHADRRAHQLSAGSCRRSRSGRARGDVL